MKIEFICKRPGCGKIGERYPSQMKNVTNVYCSYKCRNMHFSETQRGENNPNYRGGHTLNSFCECGGPKDHRATKCARCARRGIPKSTTHQDKAEYDENILREINNYPNFTLVAEALNLNRKTVARVARENGLISLKGRLPNHDKVLCQRPARSTNIRKYISKYNLLDYFCAQCENTGTWQDKELVLQLDHIDGDSGNNRLSNLRWLCPNCHSQTSTYCGKNARKEGV